MLLTFRHIARMSTNSLKYRILKIAALIVLIAAGILAGASFYLSQHYKKIIQAKLPMMAAKATDSLYLVTAGDFKVNIFGRSISIFNLRMRPDSAVLARRRLEKRLPAMILDITIPEIEISGLRLSNFAADKEVVCRKADIYHPRISIQIIDSANRDHSIKPKEKATIERVLARLLRIHDPEINIIASEEKDAATLNARGGEIALSDWLYLPGQKADSTRFLYAKESTVMLCNAGYRQPGMLYLFGMDTVQFNSGEHTARLSGVYVKPAISKPAFYREEKVQQEIYQGNFPQVAITGFDWESLLQRKGFFAKGLELTNPDLDIYVSRLYPPSTSSRVGKYPHQLLKKLGFPVSIPVIDLFYGSFHYTEFNDKTRMPGTLEFGSITGRIDSISNLPEAIVSHQHCRIRFAGKFMRKSNMAAAFTFPLDERHGEFNVQGRLQEMNGRQLSETAKALALAEIKSLQIHKVTFDICGNDYSADGRITILYNDLKVKIKKMDKETQQLYNRGFVSLVANELLLYNDNPMEGQPVRTATTHVIRDTTKSFFNLIWRNLFEAGIQTAVRQEGITDLVKKRKANKGKEKLHFFRQLFPKRNKSKGNHSTH